MFSVRLSMFIVLLGLAGCDGLTDDMLPSGNDKRPDVVAGSIGTQVSQQSPDFSVLDTLGNSRGLYAELVDTAGVVLYFYMTSCPVCDAHISHMRKYVIANVPTVKFFLVNYTSGSVSAARDTQISEGFTDIETLVDIGLVLSDLYEATMGTTIVIDSAGNIVRMNEDYKDGVKLIETLRALP